MIFVILENSLPELLLCAVVRFEAFGQGLKALDGHLTKASFALDPVPPDPDARAGWWRRGLLISCCCCWNTAGAVDRFDLAGPGGVASGGAPDDFADREHSRIFRRGRIILSLCVVTIFFVCFGFDFSRVLDEFLWFCELVVALALYRSQKKIFLRESLTSQEMLFF